MKNKKLLVSLLLVTSSLTLLGSCGRNNNTTSTISTRSIDDYDVVGQTKLNLDDDLFNTLMTNKKTSAYDKNLMDFNRDGVERMLTTTDYAPNDAKDVFTNYVDGDTTQFTSYNGNYTVKVRYLGVDTPESTSEVEEWGRSASLFNKSILKKAKYVIIQSAGSAKTGKRAPVDLDGYQRSLAYVWYSNEDNPTKNSFRNLNLELVYNGYSGFNAPSDDMKESFYNAFSDAYTIAQEYKKHKFSNEKDPNYDYNPAQVLPLDMLYDKTYYVEHFDPNTNESLGTYSSFCDDKTWYSFDGYVTRVVGGSAFYIQNKIGDNYYGLYVFTLKTYEPVQVGNWLRVTGVLDYYSGMYELKGVSYSFFNHEDKDIKYLDENGNPTEDVTKVKKETVTPIKATSQDILDLKYPSCLVELVGDGTESDKNKGLIFQKASNSFGDITYGGTQEVNTYNEAYPFYNTDNSMVLFGRYGVNSSIGGIGASDASIVRVKINRDAIIKGNYTSESYVFGSDDEHVIVTEEQAICSYKFFCGGVSYYVPGSETEKQNGMDMKVSNARYAKMLNASSSATITKGLSVYKNTYKQQIARKIVGMSNNYISAGGNNKPSIEIVNTKDFNELEDYVA